METATVIIEISGLVISAASFIVMLLILVEKLYLRARLFLAKKPMSGITRLKAILANRIQMRNGKAGISHRLTDNTNLTLLR
jgi:hypothetical protein